MMDAHRLAALATLFVGLHNLAQGDAAWAVALDMALSCIVILIVQPASTLLTEVRPTRAGPDTPARVGHVA